MPPCRMGRNAIRAAKTHVAQLEQEEAALAAPSDAPAPGAFITKQQ